MKLCFRTHAYAHVQVTNPPIDPLREGTVMSLEMTLGRKGNPMKVSS